MCLVSLKAGSVPSPVEVVLQNLTELGADSPPSLPSSRYLRAYFSECLNHNNSRVMFVLGFFEACGDPQPQILDQSRALNVKSSNVNMKVISNWNFCFL